ncbi:MAG TPA: sigma-70 family RNA polymerase sigma factor [Gemmataceae bacterium]|nr:sigma-70 family RNA polymerase sigma factor [Gemmataceae bacterium]
MPVITRAYTQLAEQTRRHELIESHLGLVRHILGKLLAQLPPGVDVENLESAGTLGLVEAAGKYDPERGIKFETYAYTRIRGAILDELRRNCPLPQHVLERVARVRKAYEMLSPGSTAEELATAAGLSDDELADCLAAMRLTRMTSWEAGDPLDARLADRGEAPDVLAERAEQKELLADAIEALPQRERLVVTLYYKEDLRLKEIGTVLKLSESRVSRVLNAAIFQMGEYMRARQA